MTLSKEKKSFRSSSNIAHHLKEEEWDASVTENWHPSAILDLEESHLQQKGFSAAKTQHHPVCAAPHTTIQHSWNTRSQNRWLVPLQLQQGQASSHCGRHSADATSESQLCRNEENAERWGLKTCWLFPLKHTGDNSHLQNLKTQDLPFSLKIFLLWG